MHKLFYSLSLLAALLLLGSCSDDDSFSTESGLRLTFSADTLSLDTLFSNVPSSTRSFWVYNHSGDGLRCQSVRLERGNQAGFRVNADGVYLSSTSGYQAQDIELRDKDSIRVFVEATTSATGQQTPKLVEDNLIFTLESGQQQKVNLRAYSWDATLCRNLRISSDTTISAASRPLVVFGSLRVDSAATLTVASGSTLYFHGDAGLDVYGTLKLQGEADNEVTLRGDRLDRMFDYLPYDRVSGQWQGIHLHSSSYDNEFRYTDIHSTFDGIVCDSSDVSRTKLTMEAATVHNCQGYGIMARNSKLVLNNTQISNTLSDRLFVDGGSAELNNCTLAQFYPFDGNRGVALRFSALNSPLVQMLCRNSLVTGYADDELMGTPADSTVAFSYSFEDCILRTPKVETADSVNFVRVLFEDPTDTLTSGKKHFVNIDTDNLRYDFSLDSISPAIDRANAATALPQDRRGKQRDAKPDIGAYEYIKP